jgi:nitrate reductase beta subunit
VGVKTLDQMRAQGDQLEGIERAMDHMSAYMRDTEKTVDADGEVVRTVSLSVQSVQEVQRRLGHLD